jgi:hypothetical protein
MVAPNRFGIQAPSRLQSPVFINDVDFMLLADAARIALVSFEADGISNPQRVTAYNGWIVQPKLTVQNISRIING